MKGVACNLLHHFMGQVGGSWVIGSGQNVDGPKVFEGQNLGDLKKIGQPKYLGVNILGDQNFCGDKISVGQIFLRF